MNQENKIYSFGDSIFYKLEDFFPNSNHMLEKIKFDCTKFSNYFIIFDGLKKQVVYVNQIFCSMGSYYAILSYNEFSCLFLNGDGKDDFLFTSSFWFFLKSVKRELFFEFLRIYSCFVIKKLFCFFILFFCLAHVNIEYKKWDIEKRHASYISQGMSYVVNHAIQVIDQSVSSGSKSELTDTAKSTNQNHDNVSNAATSNALANKDIKNQNKKKEKSIENIQNKKKRIQKYEKNKKKDEDDFKYFLY